MLRGDRTDYVAEGAWYAVEHLSYHPQDEHWVELSVRLDTGQTLVLRLYTEGEGSNHRLNLDAVLTPDEE